MNFNELWNQVRPRSLVRRFREWRARQRTKCVVQIDNPRMKIKGRAHQSEMNDPQFPMYYAFLGVPYAEPPTGPLRFKPPQPLRVRGRNRFFRAYESDNACIQPSNTAATPLGYFGSENCLYLNLYLPKKPKEMGVKRPVLVYIHGGGYHHGSGDIWDIRPDAIIRENLIFVSINYRLNIYGFLNLDTEECSGNAGLKDQVAALRWIKANIDRFGGDPDNVTLSGHSAGAACVNLHMISPLSKGLFHKAIVKGGGVYCPWGYQGDDQRPRRLFARTFRMENELRSVLVDCLRFGTAEELLDVTQRITLDVMKLESKRFMVFCGPTLERNFEGAFMSQDMEYLMQHAEPIPIIAGIAAQEGYMYILDKWVWNKQGFDNLVKKDEEFVAFLMQNLRWSYESACRHMNTLRRWYFPNLETMTSIEIQDHLASLNTDIWYRRFYDNFKIGPTRPVTAPLYVYKFCYLFSNNNLRWTNCRTTQIPIIAPSHGDEINYLFYPQYLQRKCGGKFVREVRHVINHMSSMWGNFCQNGIPASDYENIVWKPHTEEEPCYLNIGVTSTNTRSRLYEARWQKLNDLVQREPTVRVPVTPLLRSIFDFFPPSTGRSEQTAE